jgi:hypothetical protein
MYPRLNSSAAARLACHYSALPDMLLVYVLLSRLWLDLLQLYY